MSDDKGILKDFNPLNYYRSKGHTASLKKKPRRWDQYTPKYVDPKEKIEKVSRRDAALDASIERILEQLETKSFVEIKVDNPKTYMKNMYAAACRRGVQLKFSTSSYGDSVFIRK